LKFYTEPSPKVKGKNYRMNGRKKIIIIKIKIKKRRKRLAKFFLFNGIQAQQKMCQNQRMELDCVGQLVD